VLTLADMTIVLGRAAMIVLLALASAYLRRDACADEAASYVGGEVCSACHAAEAGRWKNSHHARVMQKATEATVLGDFTDARLEHFGVVTTFSRSGEKFMVRTEGPDGALHDYEIAYTFGVYPLQQYLIAFPGGRQQALGIAWDSRPKGEGGQRWFHLYPDQRVPAGDRLHWTGRDQTWNYMRADCHSTDLRKNYNLAADTSRPAGPMSMCPVRRATARAPGTSRGPGLGLPIRRLPPKATGWGWWPGRSRPTTGDGR
jgi:hypothetical protein